MPRNVGDVNKSSPKWMQRLIDRAPACFTQQQWAIYLSGVRSESHSNSALRFNLAAGVVPNYCEGCTKQHRARMEASDRCVPHHESTSNESITTK